MEKKIVTVTDDEADILYQLDNDLFWNVIDKDQLQQYRAFGQHAVRGFDHTMQQAIERAINLTIPDGKLTTNGTMR